MRRRIVTLAIAAALAISAIGSAGAYWTADPGPDPDRCGLWERQGSKYFDIYNCQWVDESPSSATGVSGFGR